MKKFSRKNGRDLKIEQKINKGIWIHNPSPCPEVATIAVTGLGRSGTTMVARMLSELGLYMGARITPRSHEDKDFQNLIKNKDFSGFENLCRERDQEFRKWGFKCPALRSEINELCEFMRNPRIVVVFRDLLAVSIRNNIALQRDVIETLLKTVKGYSAMIEQISGSPVPTLMLSYEKTLQFPEEAARTVAEFCGLQTDSEMIFRAKNTVENGDIKYLGGH